MLRAGRGSGQLAWKGVKLEVWAFAMLMLQLLSFLFFLMVVEEILPPVSLSQKPEGLGLGLAAAFVLGDAASWLGILQVQAKGPQAGEPPSPRQGGLPDKGPDTLPVSLSQKPKGLGLGLAAAFALDHTASWLGIWVPCLKACFSGSGKRFPASRRC